MDKEYRILITISLISLLMISATSSVFNATADSSISPLNDGEDRNPGPVVPDPGDRIGGFDGGTGSFVSFQPIDEGIQNFQFDGDREVIFDKISIDDFGKYEEREMGHTCFLRGNGAEFQLFDTPSTMMKLEVHPLDASDREVGFEFGDVEVKGQNETGMVEIGREDFSGDLIYQNLSRQDQNAPVERNEFNIKDEKSINFTVKKRTTFIFRMNREAFGEEISGFVREKIRTGRMGGEVIVQSNDEGYDHMSFSYRDIEMNARMRDERTLEMLVSSEKLGDEGTLLLFDISSEVMNISSEEDLELSFDGETASFVDKFSKIGESDGPSYTLVTADEGTQLIVNVPHFSTHSITVEYLIEEVEQYLGSLQYYGLTAIVTSGLVTLGLLHRGFKKEHGKKDKKVPMDRSSKKKEDRNKSESSELEN
ncbi:MAG: hypothetical protein ACLFSM_04555 [Thermoplasmata archaeon]